MYIIHYIRKFKNYTTAIFIINSMILLLVILITHTLYYMCTLLTSVCTLIVLITVILNKHICIFVIK